MCLCFACLLGASQQGLFLPTLHLQEGLVPVVIHKVAGGKREGDRERARTKVGPACGSDGPGAENAPRPRVLRRVGINLDV